MHKHTPQPTWPPIYVPLLMAGVMGVTALFLYNIYPIILGWLAAWALGIERFIRLFVSHPWIYSIVQDMLRAIYVLSTLMILTFEFFVLVYILFDEVVLHRHSLQKVLHTARKAALPAALLQLLLGLAASLLLWFFPSFDALWWLPSFWTASIPRALYTVAWELGFVLFACAFLFSNRWKQALQDTWKLLRAYKLFLALWFAALFLVTWCPAWSLQRIGITSSVCYVIGGVCLQTFVLTLGLIIFFQQAGEFDS